MWGRLLDFARCPEVLNENSKAWQCFTVGEEWSGLPPGPAGRPNGNVFVDFQKYLYKPRSQARP